MKYAHTHIYMYILIPMEKIHQLIIQIFTLILSLKTRNDKTTKSKV